MSEDHTPNGEDSGTDPRQQARRRLLKALGGAGGAFAAGKSLPETWSRPVVDAVLLPAHAQATGAGPWSGGGTAVQVGPGPAKRLGDRLLDALIPPANAGIAEDGGAFCPDIYVCIEMAGPTTAKVTIANCCDGPLAQNSSCTVTGGNKLNNCHVNGSYGNYTVNATLNNNKWTGTVEGDCPCFISGANDSESSPFDPQRKLLARNAPRSVGERMLDSVVPPAHADMSLPTTWEFTLTQGGCNTSNACDR